MLTMLENVQSKAFAYKYAQGAWSATPIPVPEHTGVSLSVTHLEADRAKLTVSSYFGPTSVWYFDAESKRLEESKKTPSDFEASKHVVEQLEATSRDGTSIPYFLVRPKNARFGGATPTLLHGYGGFQVPLLPSDLGVEDGYGSNRAMPMSLLTCAGAASLAHNGTKPLRGQRSRRHGMISLPLPRT